MKRYWDKNGLCVQISQGGTKTFYFVHGTERRFLKLGRYPMISLSQARERVRSIIAKQTLGIQDETSPVTVQDAIDRFLEKRLRSAEQAAHREGNASAYDLPAIAWQTEAHRRINRRLDALEEHYSNLRGVTKEIDEIRDEVRAIQKHLGIERKIAA